MNRTHNRPSPPGQQTLKRILVIDDSVAARTTMVDLLAAAGYQVFALASAIGATRTILRNEVVAVIADVSMPGLSGDKLVGVLRKNPRFARLCIILVSGREETELRQIVGEQDVDAVLPKRSIQDRLISTLEAGIRRRES